MRLSKSASWLFSDLKVGMWFVVPQDIERLNNRRPKPWDPNSELSVYVKMSKYAASSVELIGYVCAGVRIPLKTRVILVQSPEYGPFAINSVESVLSDLTRVGPDKPLGYLPVEIVEKLCNRDELSASLKSKGLHIIYTCKGKNKMMVAYHKEGLQKLIDEHSRAFRGKYAEWPRDAHGFARHHMSATGSSPGMYYLIAKAYADWRVDKYERGDWK